MLRPGQWVRLPDTGEVGIVVCTWHEPGIDATDAYIAFVGTELPRGKPPQLPYVLRYAAAGLEVLPDGPDTAA